MNWRPTVHSKTNVFFFITHLYQTKATITKGCKGGVRKENIIEQGQSFKQYSKMKAHQIMTRTTLSQCILCHAENGTFQYRCCTGSRVTRRESYTLSTKHRLLFSYSSFYWIQRAEPFNKWMACNYFIMHTRLLLEPNLALQRNNVEWNMWWLLTYQRKKWCLFVDGVTEISQFQY